MRTTKRADKLDAACLVGMSCGVGYILDVSIMLLQSIMDHVERHTGWLSLGLMCGFFIFPLAGRIIHFIGTDGDS